MLGKEMANITKTVGTGKDYATANLYNAGEGGVDPGAGFTAFAECSGYLGSGANINGTFIRGVTFRGDVAWDGTNDSSLSNIEQLTISTGTGVNVQDLRIFTNNQFVSALNYNADFILMNRVVLDNTTAGINAIDINGAFTNGHIRNFVARGGLDTVMAGFNQGTNLTNGLVYGATDKGVEGSSSASMIITDVFAFNNGGQDIDSAGGFTLNDVATEDLTGTYTGYTSSELVNFATGNLQTGSTSDLATLGSPFIGAILEASSGISLTVTELGPSFSDSINISLSANITSTITESGPSFADNISATLSTLTIQASITESGPLFTESASINVTPSASINASISEVGPSFTDSISVDLGVNLSATITELGPGFTDSISINITKDITASITESGPSFADIINVFVPIKITINPKNIVRVKRKENTVRIKRKSNLIRVR
jgi:hypothetical protein